MKIFCPSFFLLANNVICCINYHDYSNTLSEVYFCLLTSTDNTRLTFKILFVNLHYSAGSWERDFHKKTSSIYTEYDYWLREWSRFSCSLFYRMSIEIGGDWICECAFRWASARNSPLGVEWLGWDALIPVGHNLAVTTLGCYHVGGLMFWPPNSFWMLS